MDNVRSNSFFGAASSLEIHKNTPMSDERNKFERDGWRETKEESDLQMNLLYLLAQAEEKE